MKSEWSDNLPLCVDPSSCEGREAAVPTGIVMGILVVDSPAVGETWITVLSSMLAFGVLGIVVFCFFYAAPSSVWTPILFSKLADLLVCSFGGNAYSAAAPGSRTWIT